VVRKDKVWPIIPERLGAPKPRHSAILDFNHMKNFFGIAALSLALVASGLAQSSANTPLPISADITGMYSFVHEGEFVQIEVNDGKVTGLVSRFKNEDLEKAQFVDQFFEQATLEGARLTFRTKTVDGVRFEFSGIVARGQAKTPSEEGYWNVKGTLREQHTARDGKVSEKAHEVTLKSFPQDAPPSQATGADKKE